jgi:hypothetical protein
MKQKVIWLTYAAGHDLIYFFVVLSGKGYLLSLNFIVLQTLRVGAVWSINKTPTLVGVFLLIIKYRLISDKFLIF